MNYSSDRLATQLVAIFRDALEASSPDKLLRSSQAVAAIEGRVDLLSIGKCALAMDATLRELLDVRQRLVIVPEGYGGIPSNDDAVLVTSHPVVSERSFAAGERMLRFASAAQGRLVVALSGGASAAAEKPLAPWFTSDDIVGVQRLLLDRGLAIEEVNTIRKHLSALKGGRLALASQVEVTTLLISDVDPATPHVAGSGPTVSDPTTNEDAAALLETLGGELALRLARRLRDPEVPDTPKTLAQATLHVAGDNATLVARAATAARARGFEVRQLAEQIGGDVEQVAARFVALTAELPPGTLLIAGGEPTVRIHGNGRGGRCSELAARFAAGMLAAGARAPALFAASDGVDGSSGAAGVFVDPGSCAANGEMARQLRGALDRSDTISVAGTIGGEIRMVPTGNNLRDLFILAWR